MGSRLLSKKMPLSNTWIMGSDGIMVFRLASQVTYLSMFEVVWEIAYTCTKSFMKRIAEIEKCIFVNGSNLLTFCNKALGDAESRT